MNSSTRPAAVAGRFYPGDAEALEADVRSYLSPSELRTRGLGCVIPHAGYVYSGQVAGAVFAKLEIPSTCIILCPNHTGMGDPLAIMSEGAWDTPLGLVQIDSELAHSLKRAFSALSENAAAHRSEHAIEVILPFLQVQRPQCRFVPIALGTGRFEMLLALGEAIAETIKAHSDPILVIASSDMNHYENDAITRLKDRKAIERVLDRDPGGLFEVVKREQISMCGFGPTVAMLTAANRMSATRAELVRYATSGDVSGDRDMVVGYAGFLIQ
jgi:AmmeMemoRadiSam system protein B